MVEVEGRRIGGKKKRKRTHRARKKGIRRKKKKEKEKKTSRDCRAKTGEGPVFIPHVQYYVRLSPGSVGQIRLSQTETSDTEHYPKPNDGFLLTNRNALRICGEEKITNRNT